MPENLYCKGQLMLSEKGKENWDKIRWDYMKDPDEWHFPKDKPCVWACAATRAKETRKILIFGGRGT